MAFNIFNLFKAKSNTDPENEPHGAATCDISNFIKNEIAITVTDKKPKENESKFGGSPYLPASFKWPYYNGEDYDGVKKSRPLSFLAQIDLSAAHPFDKDGRLPESGMLYFFYEIETMKWGFDPEDEGCARVYYFEKTEGFTETNAPKELSSEYILPELKLEFSSQISLPSYEELSVHAPKLFDSMDYEDYEAIQKNHNVSFEQCERCKLLGYADLIQGEALTDCEATARGIYMGNGESWSKLSADKKADVKMHASDWVLLFQMSSICDTDPEIMWGDMGNLYFYVRKDDLAARRFDKVKLTLQCG